MEYIVTDRDLLEVAVLNISKTIDIDIGGSNDLELTVSAEDSDLMQLEFGAAVFAPGTEYGGIIRDRKSTTASQTVKWYADTWRGMLAQKIVEPPAGLAYRTVSGDAHAVLRQLTNGLFNGIIQVPAEDSGITVSYQIPRYVSLLEAITGMLATVGARPDIRAVQGGPGEAFYVQLSAVPVVDYSEDLEYSQDNRISMTIRDYRRGINHLICLGKGELTERLVLHLYVQQDGSIGDTKYYTGVDERSATYDYTSADDAATLRTNGIKRLKELMDYQELGISVDGDIDLEIGDIVAGRDRKTGAYLQQPITEKVLRVDGLTESISYSVKGGN